ncbi:MAG TPA: GMC family oxidoreductase N-terminal domain-containing protein [Geminicoccus sp.]|jgi:choline dehydrogenase|uniref:GMC family oxidoreductase n=1 Tax=Geminicoccus sp. TaxID=2024832 RepID=UPI002E2EA65D|nr:GMC family oxidoreductase N-terminal domain-containing protein [Geminicoccus sp.]HEX2526313.1 GMC family oxidoreductase N-terminal domain-containing protein [Geminicoccus sp.]
MDSSQKERAVVSYDYIVIGGGSAGCVAAWRLTQEFGAKVLLLEAGGPDDGWLLRIPAGFVKLLSSKKYMSHHETVPQPQLDGRVLTIPQGRVLGGGSSINAQAYMRGRIADYDAWGELAGSEAWSWEKILPHFKALEGNQRFNDELHGIDGPLKVGSGGFVCDMTHMFVRAVQGMGVPFRADFNNGSPGGVGYLQITGTPGRRCSAVDAFLRPVMDNPNLHLRTHAHVTKIIVQNGRAMGVEFIHDGKIESAHVDGEVLVAGGAFVSPKLLMLSGIGPADHLRSLGIEVKVDLPGVGQNLQDHPGSPVVASTNGNYGHFGHDRGLKMVLNGIEYVLFRRGRITSTGVEACSFHVPEDGTGDPVMQVYCVPTTSYAGDVPAVDGVTLHTVLLRPRSVGWVKLRSADPNDMPLVHPNYLEHPDDMRHHVAGVRAVREIMRSRPLADVIVDELLPGPQATSDEDIAAHLRRTARTDFHPVGTCRMGRSGDPATVVGPDLAVQGVMGLRVIDASIMPKLVSANTNAPTMAIADRAISLVRGVERVATGATAARA